MKKEEFLTFVNEQGAMLCASHITVDQQLHSPGWTGAYQAKNYWVLYETNERGETVCIDRGSEERIFSRLYMIFNIRRRNQAVVKKREDLKNRSFR